MPQDLAIIVSLACAIISASCAVYVALRDSRWRKSGLASQLEGRIAAAHEAADKWHESEAAREMKSRLAEHGRTLGAHGTKINGLATKEDVAAVAGLAAGMKAKLDHTADGVDRIEGILIKRALNGEAP